MKKKRKAWFTLIEIIIVVIIIGILMLIGLWFNRSHLASLKSNTKIEQVKSDFDTFFLQILNSSSYQGKQYHQATLTLTKWEIEPIKYAFSQPSSDSSKTEEQNQTSSFFSPQNWNFQITKLDVDWSEKDQIRLTYKPYQLACSLQRQEGNHEISLQGQEGNHKIFLTLQPKWWKEVCFQLQTSYCRIQSVPCKTLSQN